MVILHVITDLTKGGAELKLARLVAAHHDHPDYRHRVISLRTIGAVGERIRALGIEVEALGMERWWRVPAAMIRLRNRIRALDPDIVQTWMYHADLFGGLAARWAGAPTILWGVRLADFAPDLGISRLTYLVRWLCAHLSRSVPARIVYVAESARRRHEEIGYDPAKSVVIHNGYLTPREDDLHAWRAGRRRELSLPDKTVLIGSAGRFAPQKNFAGFVRAAGIVASRYPEARFLLAGTGLDRDNRELLAWIDRAGIADRTTLIGERSDLDEWLAALDIFALFSNSEGLPNVVAEAMAVGIPCVVTAVGDAALLVGDTGKVVPPRDVEALAAALQEMIGARETLHRQGIAARVRIAAEFSMDAAVVRYERLYRTVTAR